MLTIADEGGKGGKPKTDSSAQLYNLGLDLVSYFVTLCSSCISLSTFPPTFFQIFLTLFQPFLSLFFSTFSQLFFFKFLFLDFF